MSDTQKQGKKYHQLPIRPEVKEKLMEYRERMKYKPTLVDLSSLIIEEWLERQTAEENIPPAIPVTRADRS